MAVSNLGRARKAALTGLGLGGLVVGAVFAPLSFADPKVSTLVASPTSVPLDISGPTSGQVTVDLDNNCANVFDSHHNQYSVTATSANTAVATVSPDTSPGRFCDDPAYPFTVATHAYNSALLATDPVNVAACAAVGSTTVNFHPVSGPPGQQKKLAGASVAVTVTDNSGHCGGGGGGGGGGGDERPAAPAVTNAYLNANSALATACKSAFGNAKSWRGNLVSFIAGWMPKPESVKEAPPVGIFVDADDWISYVQSEVNHKCAFSGGPDYDTTGQVPPLSAYSP